MKFEIKDLKYGGYKLYDKSNNYLISLGEIYLNKDNFASHCCQSEDKFDYHGIQKALIVKEPKKFGLMCFTPKRILVIQMI